MNKRQTIIYCIEFHSQEMFPAVEELRRLCTNNLISGLNNGGEGSRAEPQGIAEGGTRAPQATAKGSTVAARSPPLCPWQAFIN